MQYIDHSEELFHSSKNIPKNPDNFFKYFIKQLEQKTLSREDVTCEIAEIGPREKLSTKFELIGLINSTLIFTVRFDITSKSTDIYFGFKFDVFGQVYEKKNMKKILKKRYQHHDELYFMFISPHIRSLAEKSINYINNLTEPVVIQKKTEQEIKGRGILVFISYATVDASTYRINEIAAELTKLPIIFDVLYWQEDMHDNIIEYMNDNLGNCDVILLFCSPNALNSDPVKKEWTAAEAMNKPIIPIFKDPDHIPPLLKSRLGMEFDDFSIENNIKKLHELIVKKIE